MDKDQLKAVNETFFKQYGEFVEKISTDWEVDTAGNASISGDKFREDLAHLKDEFKESS